MACRSTDAALVSLLALQGPAGGDVRHVQQKIKTKVAPSQPQRRKRIPREERHRLIIEEATILFAEKGLSADMRELARRLGITHPALFRHFANKDALIAEVYEHTFMDGWDPAWEAMITDRTMALPERLATFYKSFARVALSFTWVRLYMFAALEGLEAHKTIYRFIGTRLIRLLCTEIRASYDLPSVEELPLQELEIELVWSFHSRIFYLGIRKHIYGMRLPDDLDGIISAEAATMTTGLGPYLSSMLKNLPR
ncbi:MAG: TetR/AcrR family transcriptional regulator [Sphingobium sp.]